LKSFGEGDLKGILSDYAPGAFLFTPDFFRYMLPFPKAEKKSPIFLPYWRFKGSLFSALSTGVDHRILDVTSQAVLSGYFPSSLGLRAQAMKLT
jgi:hypothetical protein